jgi:hypothetical protein
MLQGSRLAIFVVDEVVDAIVGFWAFFFVVDETVVDVARF